jgi:hypothetical protein
MRQGFGRGATGVSTFVHVEACYLGWQELLTLLAQLVGAETPGRPAQELPLRSS